MEQEETTIDLAELFYRLLDKAKFIIVAALLGAIIAFCATKFFMTPMYQASAKLYVLNSSGTSLNLSQIQLSSSRRRTMCRCSTTGMCMKWSSAA